MRSLLCDDDPWTCAAIAILIIPATVVFVCASVPLGAVVARREGASSGLVVGVLAGIVTLGATFLLDASVDSSGTVLLLALPLVLNWSATGLIVLLFPIEEE